LSRIGWSGDKLISRRLSPAGRPCGTWAGRSRLLHQFRGLL